MKVIKLLKIFIDEYNKLECSIVSFLLFIVMFDLVKDFDLDVWVEVNVLEELRIVIFVIIRRKVVDFYYLMD